VIFHFILPYVMLLARDIKRDWSRVSKIALWIVGIRVVDYYWHVAPEFHNDGLSLGLIDVALPIALGGIFVMLFAMQLKGRPLLPLQDEGLAKALTHHTH
jgi:cytosine/uracil/thiamine/allantoin permease